jgi:cell division protein FtsB
MLHKLLGIRSRKRLYRLLMALILLVLVFFIGKSVWFGYQKNRIVKDRYEEVKNELETLEKRDEGLREEINRLSTERGIEEELRSKFQVSKPGEQTAVIVESESVKGENSKKEGWWGKIKNFFK